MNQARKMTQDYILKHIGDMMDGDDNVKIYQELFDGMTDEAFDLFIDKLEKDEAILGFIAPNFNKNKLMLEKIFDVAEAVGVKLFQRIWLQQNAQTPRYLSPIPILVCHQPYRRQAQVLEKKISIPEDNNTVDNLTGQPTGSSKGSKISYMETQVLASQNLDNTLLELLKYRGGDEKGFQNMNNMIATTGSVKLAELGKYNTTVKSTETLHVILTAMHIKNTLMG